MRTARDTAARVTPEAWLFLAVVVHLAIAWWWIGTDTHTPDAETARQIGFSFRYTDAMADGDLLAPFRGTFDAVQDLYPPIHGLLASVWSLVFGKTIAGALAVQTLVYLPLTVIGSYGAGRVLYGRTGGVLTGVFVMAIPVFGPLFHVYLIDTATLAFAAPAIWLLLLSRRFELAWVALAAGVAVGLGMLTKTSFGFVWPGLVAVMLLRGGWRNWRGALVFAAAAVVVAAPWYLTHVDELRQQADFYSGDYVVSYTPSLGNMQKFSLRHLSYYPRALLAVDLFLPLTLLFVAGSAFSVVRFVRTRRSDDYTPELIVGLLVFWYGLLNVSTVDWRLCVAGIVYVALLGTGWMVRLRRPYRIAAASILGALFVVNTVMPNFNVGPDVRASPHGFEVALVSSKGAVVNKPNGTSRLEAVMRAAHAAGIRSYWVAQQSESPPDFVLPGLGVFAAAADVDFTDVPRLGADTVGILTRGVNRGDPPPCSWLTQPKLGAPGIYLFRGPVTTKRLTDVVFAGNVEGVKPYCPLPPARL